jgi:anti-sigma factor RsiW
MKGPAITPVPGDLACRELVEVVTDYLEDRLPLDERTRVELHLCTCRPCKVYLRQLRATVAAAGRLAQDDLEPAVRDALLEAFRGWKRTG